MVPASRPLREARRSVELDAGEAPLVAPFIEDPAESHDARCITAVATNHQPVRFDQHLDVVRHRFAHDRRDVRIVEVMREFAGHFDVLRIAVHPQASKLGATESDSVDMFYPRWTKRRTRYTV